MNSALIMGGWGLAQHSGRFTSSIDPVHLVQEAGWASRHAWTGSENLAPQQPDSISGPYIPYLNHYTY
jgi:hypothetical protein